MSRQLNALERRVDQALGSDRAAARRELSRLRQAARRQGSDAAELEARCRRLAERLETSAAVRRERLSRPPTLSFDPALPISAHREELAELIKRHQVLIVAGETGSGKTTQLPKICLAAGRGVDGLIGLTQPRRIAALTIGRRIAEELGDAPGGTVGCKIRFQDSTAAGTRIKVMTDGILLAEAHGDRLFSAYDTLIVDEAHERSLNIDFILGLLKMLLPRRRDLRVIITSATIDTEKFSRAFEQAPVVEVSGRMYPVETRWQPPEAENGEEAGPVDLAARAVEKIARERRAGDILVFMPTEQDIRDTCDLLEGRRLPATRVMPLFARLSAAEQQKVFLPTAERKIIVATNVAETSITIPGIHVVVDTGLARISQYTPRSRTTTLPVVPIARSSADQRQGRCGRVADGICIRLYSEEDYTQRPRFTPPEILRANLAEVILRMLALKLGQVEDFPFIDPPAARSIQDGYKLLLELGAIAERPESDGRGRFILTARGRLMARLPLDPRLSRILLSADERRCLDDVAVIAAALSVQDPRERPADKQEAADRAQACFSDPLSDFVTLLNIWHGFQQAVRGRESWAQVKKYCRDHFLSFRRMREWQDIHGQILAVLAEQGIRPHRPPQPFAAAGDIADSRYAAVHQAILSGFLSNIAMQKEKQIFQAAYSRQAMIFPGSGLFKNPGRWIVAAEMVETSRLFARGAAVIDPRWIEPVGGAQCRHTYSDPHWEKRRGEVTATEQVSLYGLIVDRRSCAYGPVNGPEAAEIFFRDALIAGEVQRPPAFLKHNLRLIGEVEEWQARLRRRDLLVGEHVLLDFYRQHLGVIYDIRTLLARIRRAGGDDFLRLQREDLLNYDPRQDLLGRYPDRIHAGSQSFPCDYRFEPGKEDDGVTVRVPAAAAGGVAPESFQWLVPGLLRDKIAALLKNLPKELRKQLVPLSDTLDIILEEMPPQRETSLTNALGRFIAARFGLRIPAAAWDESQLPDHLRMRIALTDAEGRVVRSGRDASILSGPAAPPPRADEFFDARRAWERGDIREWDFGDLPQSITLTGPGGLHWTAFPALEDRGGHIALTALPDLAQAVALHPRGVRVLFIRRFSVDVKYLRRNLALPPACEPAARYFGGRRALEELLFERVQNDLFARDIHTQAGFEAACAQLGAEGGVAAAGQPLRGLLIDILGAYHDCSLQLFSYEKQHIASAPLSAWLAGLRAELQRLVPPNFIVLYDGERLQHLPRYIRALCVRAERGLINQDKDRAKALQLAPYLERLEKAVQSLGPQASAEKRLKVEEFFWLLEEYKISLFAQEIKTARPVSAKRLNEAVREIEGMS